MKVYIATSFSKKDDFLSAARMIEESGHLVAYDWTTHKPIRPYEDNIKIARHYSENYLKKPEHSTKVFTATKAFIIYNNQVLILKESNKYQDGTLGDKWGLPGGRVEPGQHFKDSLLREVKEETGLDVEVGNPFFTTEWRPKVRGEQWQIVGTFFECTAHTDQVMSGQDHDDFKWIGPADYRNFNLIDNLNPVFEAYLEINKTKR